MVRRIGLAIKQDLRSCALACLRPFGYLAFVVALWTLSAAARLLGEKHELGFFAGRLNQMIWRYPDVTRRGVQMAWLVWLVLFAVAVSPFDPLSTSWDEVALVALAAGVLWRQRFGRRVGR
jgi:hypothetical protein